MNFFENLIYSNDFQLKVRKFPSKCVHLIEIKQKKVHIIKQKQSKTWKSKYYLMEKAISLDGGDIVL